MGLDMYLDEEHYISKSDWKSGSDKPCPVKEYKRVLEAADIKDIDSSGVGYVKVSIGVAYWRKANMIHAWMLKKARVEDECQRIYVPREWLLELWNTCIKVLENRSRAKYLLPTLDGFFFGNTQYGNDYFEDVKWTRDQLGKILERPKDVWVEYVYQASW